MEIVEPKATLWTYDNPIEHIARCARVCYASDKTSNNAKFVDNLWKNKHYSMLRHVGVYYVIPEKLQISKGAFLDADYVLIKNKYYISTNEQAAKEYWDEHYRQYRLNHEEASNIEIFYQHKLIRYTFCVETGIDITREYNRKSPNAIAEQSTRYVDFVKKIGIKFKKCHWMSNCNRYRTFLYKFMLKTSEWFYKIARSKYGLNLPPQDARFILPLDTMSKAVYTYTVKDWEYIINMRLFNYTGVAHKDAQIIARQIFDQLGEEGYCIDNYNHD